MKTFAIPLFLLGLAAMPALAAPHAQARQTPADAAAALIARAHAAQNDGQTELALRLAQSAIVADPAQAAPYVALGDVYAEAGEKDYAQNYYDEALSIDPADPSALKAVAALDHKMPRLLAKP